MTELPSATFAVRAEPDGCVVVNVAGEVDLLSRDAFSAAVGEALQTSPSTLAFELAEVRFIDSSGLAVLVSAANAGPAVEVRTASEIVRRLIEVSGLAALLVMPP